MNEKNVTGSSRMHDTIIDFLVDIPLFDTLIAEDLSIVAKHMNFIEIEKDEILFKEGDRGDYVCFIVKGVLDVVKKAETGRTVVIAKLGKGRSIGEMSIIDNTPRSATIRASVESTLLILSQKGFELVIEKHPAVGIKILKGIARLLSMNMRKTSSQLANILPIVT